MKISILKVFHEIYETFKGHFLKVSLKY